MLLTSRARSKPSSSPLDLFCPGIVLFFLPLITHLGWPPMDFTLVDPDLPSCRCKAIWIRFISSEATGVFQNHFLVILGVLQTMPVWTLPPRRCRRFHPSSAYLILPLPFDGSPLGESSVRPSHRVESSPSHSTAYSDPAIILIPRHVFLLSFFFFWHPGWIGGMRAIDGFAWGVVAPE